MIEVRNLTKDYGPHRAVDHLNFKVNPGEVVGFLGPNGAGKSTTMKIITGYMSPTSGQAEIAGFDVFANPIEVKKRIGYLPENPPVYLDMYVAEYLRFVAKLKGVPSHRLKDHVDQALQKTDLTGVSQRLINNLSKGYRQRVGIAQALVSQPDILILDEPTVGLDPKQVAEIRGLIKSLKAHHTIILSTHILPEVEATCERIIIINKGKIVAQDSLQGLSAMKQGYRKVRLRIARPSAELFAGLKELVGVKDLSLTDSAGLVRLDTDEDEQVLEAISAYVVEKRAGLLELRSEQKNLEEIFIKLTYDQNQPEVNT